jgi:hypothetical protein
MVAAIAVHFLRHTLRRWHKTQDGTALDLMKWRVNGPAMTSVGHQVQAQVQVQAQAQAQVQAQVQAQAQQARRPSFSFCSPFGGGPFAWKGM